MNEEQELPQGWELVKLRQVVATDGVFIDGDWVESKDQDPEGDIRLIQLADVGDGNYRNRSNRFMTLEKATKLNCTFMQAGDVLVARMPDPLGRACIFPGDEKKAVTVVDVCIIRTGKSGVDHRWLMNTLNSSVVRASIAALQSGSTRLRISRKNLETIEFPLPPLPEQRRIVAKLEELFSRLDAGVAAVRRSQALLKRYRQSVLHAAVTGELTRAWREAHPTPPETGEALLTRIRAERRAQWEAAQVAKRGGQLPLNDAWKKKYEEPASPDTSELPELPAGWVWAGVEQLGEVTGGLTKNAKRASLPLQIPYLRVANVQANELRLEQIEQIGVTESEVPRTLLKAGDLLVVEGNGSPDQIGRVAIWHGSISPCLHQNHLIKVRLHDTEQGSFVLHWLLSKEGRDHIRQVASSTSGLYTLSISKIGALPVPLPPLTEQVEIVAEVERRLTVLDTLSQTLTAELKRAERLRQSLLHRAFTGRLVPQEATDEPAAALLARLREGAATGPVKGKAGRGRKAPAQATLDL